MRNVLRIQTALMYQDLRDGTLLRQGFRWHPRFQVHVKGPLRFHPRGLWVEEDFDAMYFDFDSGRSYWVDHWVHPDFPLHWGTVASAEDVEETLLPPILDYESRLILGSYQGLAKRERKLNTLTDWPSSVRSAWRIQIASRFLESRIVLPESFSVSALSNPGGN